MRWQTHFAASSASTAKLSSFERWRQTNNHARTAKPSRPASVYIAMMMPRHKLLSAFLVCALFTPLAYATNIPETHAVLLSGEKIDLPASLNGKVTVLVVGFSQKATDQIAGWGRRLAGDYKDSNSVVYYEMASLGGVPKFLRGFVLGKIKGAVPPLAQPHFFPFYDHEPEWKIATNFSSANDAYVLLVDSSGTVKAQTAGAITEAGYADFKQKLDALRSKP